MADLKRVLVEIRVMVLRREYELRVQIGLLRRDILCCFPLKDLDNHEAIDLLFSSPVCQQVLMEHIQKTIMLWNIQEPNQNDVALVTMELIFSGYLRAHLAFGNRRAQ